MDTKKLRDTIWTTRISRVNAEQRLLNKEAFVEWLNIYYSFIIICLSIVLLQYNSKLLSYCNLFISLCLLLSILHLKSYKLKEQALSYRNNYSELYKLEMSLNDNIQENTFVEIQNKYCELLKESENHIPYDYYKTVFNSNYEYYKFHSSNMLLFKYFLNILYRFMVKTILVFFPLGIIGYVYFFEEFIICYFK